MLRSMSSLAKKSMSNINLPSDASHDIAQLLTISGLYIRLQFSGPDFENREKKQPDGLGSPSS